MTFYNDLVADADHEAHTFVRVQRDNDRAMVTLDDTDKLNVLSAPLTRQLKAAVQELVDDLDIRAIVLTGAGDGFSAGGDLQMMERAPEALAAPEGSTDIWRWIRYEFGAIARLIARSDTAFIAAINGPAAGVGLAWALTCDIVIASERAVIVPAFGRLGLLPEVGTSWALTRRLGYQGAFAYYVAGEHLDARERRNSDWCTRSWHPTFAQPRRCLVHPDRRAPPARRSDDETAPARRRRRLLGASDRDGRVRRTTVLYHPRVPAIRTGPADPEWLTVCSRRRLATNSGAFSGPTWSSPGRSSTTAFGIAAAS